MSVYTSASSLPSILKSFSSLERDKAKNAAINKVRFEMPKQKGLLELVKVARELDNFQSLNEFAIFLREMDLSEEEFMRIVEEARIVVNDLNKNSNVVQSLLSMPWMKRTPEAVQAYTDLYVDILVAHSKYIDFGITKLISLWIPADDDAESWKNGVPDENMKRQLQTLHKLLDRILNAIPLAFDIVLAAIETKFPYFKRPTYVVAGYFHNLICLMQNKPIFTQVLMELALHKLIILDVNAPRSEIEETDDMDTDDESDVEMDAEQIFEMDKDIEPMKHAIANTLDICMEKLYSFLDTKNPCNKSENLSEEEKLQLQRNNSAFFKIFWSAFDNVVLPCHNTHHVQFLMFYYCSFKQSHVEAFLDFLWQKIKDPNVFPIIRQAAVGYIASFLARAKFVPISTIRKYLKELCNWAHQYIETSDQYRSNGTLKANLVFYSCCQAVFYVIAFRARDLTANNKSLLFLQSLHLSALVTCNFNPLRVCLPAVATAFAGVTRAYQLAYCHAILERNARRKLATVYANDTSTLEEVLDTFFPFDPYLLKLSFGRINPHYLQYQASDAEDHVEPATNKAEQIVIQNRRKRGDSEMTEEIDDFLITDKRQKFIDIARSHEREAQFTYGLSPGFHT